MVTTVRKPRLRKRRNFSYELPATTAAAVTNKALAWSKTAGFRVADSVVVEAALDKFLGLRPAD